MICSRTSSGMRFQTPIRPGRTVVKGRRSAGLMQIVPAIESRPGNAELLQRSLDRQMRLLDQPDDLKLLGGWVQAGALAVLYSTGTLRRRTTRIGDTTKGAWHRLRTSRGMPVRARPSGDGWVIQ